MFAVSWRKKVAAFTLIQILSSADDSTFLLFSKKQEIRGVDLENATFNVIPALTVPFVYNPLAIDYDLRSKRLYWTDDDTVHGQNGIHTATLNGTDVHTIIDSGARARLIELC